MAPGISAKDPDALLCHWMVPVYDVKLIVVEPPVHTDDAAALAVPPADGGAMETVAVVEVDEAHMPLVTIAL